MEEGEEVTKRDFWQIVGEVRRYVPAGDDLECGLVWADTAITAEGIEWQVEF
jgi:hypothetical protein